MAFLNFNNMVVRGVACSVPKQIRYSSEFEHWLGKDGVDKFIENVGVVSGHVTSSEQTAADLCFDAANRLLNELEIDRGAIDILLFVTQTPDYIAPSSACVLQHRLGLSESCGAYDINLACSGYVYGLSSAMGYLSCGSKKVLLLAGDTVSKHCSPEDRALTMLSTDAGTATLIEYGESDDSMFHLKTLGKGFKSLIVPSGGYKHRVGTLKRTDRGGGTCRNDYDGYMNGADVFRFSISEVPKMYNEYIMHFGDSAIEFDTLFMHQANLFIIKHISKRLKVNMSSVPVSMDRYGNTGAASIPTTICDFYASDEPQLIDETVGVCGFGIGLSLGFGKVHLKQCTVLPIKTTDVTFDDEIGNIDSETLGFLEK